MSSFYWCNQCFVPTELYGNLDLTTCEYGVDEKRFDYGKMMDRVENTVSKYIEAGE